MPIRIIVAFGPPFGSFHMGFRAGHFGLDWPEGFAGLEAALLREFKSFASPSPARRARLRTDPSRIRTDVFYQVVPAESAGQAQSARQQPMNRSTT